MTRNILAGVDIGGTKTAVVLSLQPPAILKRIEFPTCVAEGPEPALAQIIGGIHEALSSQHLDVECLKAIGVSCGSPLDPVRGVILAPPNLSTWKNVPIKSLLTNEFGVDCIVENDANAGALAEHLFGAGKGSRDMVFLTMGTGLGAGLILNGHLYRGTSYTAGEIGHVRLTRSGPIGYHKAGSAEGWASGAGMARVATQIIKKALIRGEATILASGLQDLSNKLSAKDIWLAAQRGDAVAQNIVRKTGEKLGAIMAIFIDLLNPERIVVGGLALRMGEALLEPARAVVKKEALRSSAAACQITAAGLDEEIGDIAALCVAIREDNNGR
jgi:glucokinase